MLQHGEINFSCCSNPSRTRRQILTYKDVPRTEIIKLFLMVRMNPKELIYDDFKSKKPRWFKQKYISFLRVDTK